jgi:threonine dehydratase
MQPNQTSVTIEAVREAEAVVHRYVDPSPLVRSYAMEKELGLPASRRVWFKDYGWTPSGSFKVMGALNWVHAHRAQLERRPVTAHSSGNFASGLAYACREFQRRAIIVMPDNAPRIKFELTRAFGAEVQTYDIAHDHETGERDRLAKEIAEREQAIQASPYDDPAVIAGNGVGGLEIVERLQGYGRSLSHFVCPVSGGGLMAGHLLALGDAFPRASFWAVEPEKANDFQQSLLAGTITTLARPESICDGLLSYSVGQYNWPILQRYVCGCLAVEDRATQLAMSWIYDHHGLRCEPSGAIAVAALLQGELDVSGDGDVVVVISGRNIDDDRFLSYRREVEPTASFFAS